MQDFLVRRAESGDAIQPGSSEAREFHPVLGRLFSKRFLQRGMGSKREFWERACMKGLLNPAQRIIGQQPRK
jgi:hypothetical protein|tara:strand:- start:95 stop:310 length:216 start_codon:yes stop_codon:yes gene_type:complete